MKSKNLTCIILFCMFVPGITKCQLRHVKGIDDIGAGLMILSNGIGAEALYQRYFTGSLFLKAGIAFEKRNIKNGKYNNYYILPQVYKTVLSNQTNLFFNITGGMLLGMENSKNEITQEKDQRFIIGERLGLNLEFFIYKNLKIEIEADQYFMQRSNFLKSGQVYLIKAAIQI